MNMPIGHRIGSARCQFIAEVRRISAGVEQGRAASEGMRDIRRALATLDKAASKGREDDRRPQA